MSFRSTARNTSNGCGSLHPTGAGFTGVDFGAFRMGVACEDFDLERLGSLGEEALDLSESSEAERI